MFVLNLYGKHSIIKKMNNNTSNPGDVLLQRLDKVIFVFSVLWLMLWGACLESVCFPFRAFVHIK